jgi:hypothetical protein
MEVFGYLGLPDICFIGNGGACLVEPSAALDIHTACKLVTILPVVLLLVHGAAAAVTASAATPHT